METNAQDVKCSFNAHVAQWRRNNLERQQHLNIKQSLVARQRPSKRNSVLFSFHSRSLLQRGPCPAYTTLTYTHKALQAETGDKNLYTFPNRCPCHSMYSNAGTEILLQLYRHVPCGTPRTVPFEPATRSKCLPHAYHEMQTKKQSHCNILIKSRLQQKRTPPPMTALTKPAHNSRRGEQLFPCIPRSEATSETTVANGMHSEIHTLICILRRVSTNDPKSEKQTQRISDELVKFQMKDSMPPSLFVSSLFCLSLRRLYVGIYLLCCHRCPDDL